MYLIEKEDYTKAKPLAKGCYNIEINAILSGFSKGMVYIDDLQDPKVGLVWTDDGCFFIGEPSDVRSKDNLLAFMDTVIANYALSKGLKWCEMCSTSPAWEGFIEEVFKAKGVEKSDQHVLRMDSIDQSLLDLTVPEGMKIEAAHLGLFAKDYPDLAYFKRGIEEFWDSIEDFCARGFGYFLTLNGEILSRCTLDFKYDGSITLGVSTAADHRKKGYAKKVVSYALKHCMEHDLRPYWDCMDSNKGSIALAKSVGFHMDYTYYIYEYLFSNGANEKGIQGKLYIG